MPGRPGEARDRVFGAVGESLRVGGHDLGAASPKNEVLRSDQKVSYLDHFSLQHIRYPLQYFIPAVSGQRLRRVVLPVCGSDPSGSWYDVRGYCVGYCVFDSISIAAYS